MQFKAFLAAAFAATAMAQDSSLTSELASLTSNLGLPSSDLSIFSVLSTALPSGFVTALRDPAVSSSFASELSAGNYPSWYSALPSDVKSYINSVASVATHNACSSQSAVVVERSEILCRMVQILDQMFRYPGAAGQHFQCL
ncbi:hypothetical protein GJ744_009721 [Endocarpon pusillum]|uniref:Uncharacterized protein n=1 Tax=Endocarpon pusillum TaxID=364733 RepID=A0A8H7APY3_9EURO|nr:hypothetical protein GJ744_009721 [Endocarpon pusillum]